MLHENNLCLNNESSRRGDPVLDSHHMNEKTKHIKRKNPEIILGEAHPK